MTVWQDRLNSTCADYGDRLEQRGFVAVGDDKRIFAGAVTSASGEHRIVVVLPEAFPFRPPLVRLEPGPQAVDVTWHVSPSGELCLYIDDDENTRPWDDVDQFLRRVAGWFDEAAQGWPEDAPVMDADRYIESEPSSSLLVYGDLTAHVGRYVQLRLGKNKTIRLHAQALRPPVPKNQKRVYGAVRDIGVLERPVRSWDDVRALVLDADQLEKDLRQRRIVAVLLVYERAGRKAVLPLRVDRDRDGFRVSAFEAASDTDVVRRFRSGPGREQLSQRRVLIVGVGAVGSFMADLLARDGVGDLGVRDWQHLTPGNVIRHLCGSTDVGRMKADAVAANVHARYETKVHAVNESLRSLDDAVEAVQNYDLVVDATARGYVTALLREAASLTGRNVLTVCVQNDGDVARVDVMPPLSGAPLPPTPTRPPTGPEFFEGACGDPVSPTPPHAVVQAATLAAAHAVGLLTDAPLNSAGQVVDMAP